MKIIGQTNNELVLFSPATGSRFMSGLMIGLGGLFFLLAASLCLACLGVPVIAKPIGGFWTQAAGIGFLVIVGLTFGIPGAVMMSRLADLTFYFKGTTGQLFVRSKRGDEVFPLSDIIRAEVVEESDEGIDVYGLCLVLRNSLRRLQCTDFLTQGRRSKEELADQINQFLSRSRQHKSPDEGISGGSAENA
jgi:hypothetical protein